MGMEYIHSNEIFLLTRDTLKFIDRRIMDHGSRVAYYVYKMLQCKGGYVEYELADLMMVAALHDIGAYKTDDWDDMLQVEVKNYMPHSIYGYLFFKYLSPMDALSKVILYHHMDCAGMADVKYEYKDIAAYICLADRMDVYLKIMGSSFDINTIRSAVGIQFTKESIDLFYQAVRKYDMQEKIRDGSYKQELKELSKYMLFSNEHKKKYLEMLMYCQGFRSEYTVVDTITCICIAEEIGNAFDLSEEEMDLLYYGALLHDIGMLAIPKEIIEAPRKLTKEEYRLLQKHIPFAEKVLGDRMAKEVMDLIVTHHERCDGSGYPRGLRGYHMTKLQKILQIADSATAMKNKRAYKDSLSREKIIANLTADAATGKYEAQIVGVFVNQYDFIMERVDREASDIMKMYRKLNTQFTQVSGTMNTR